LEIYSTYDKLSKNAKKIDFLIELDENLPLKESRRSEFRTSAFTRRANAPTIRVNIRQFILTTQRYSFSHDFPAVATKQE